MSRALLAAFLCALCALALGEADIDVDAAAFGGFPMRTYRMCAAFHNEGCAQDAGGPCLERMDCVRVVCDNRARAGSCARDPTLDFCDDVDCPFAVRQQSHPVVRMAAKVWTRQD